MLVNSQLQINIPQMTMSTIDTLVTSGKRGNLSKVTSFLLLRGLHHLLSSAK